MVWTRFPSFHVTLGNEVMAMLMENVEQLGTDERVALIDAWRFGTATDAEEFTAWSVLEQTVRNRSTKHFKNNPDWGSQDRNTLRTLFLAQYLKENKDLSVLSCIARWRKLFPAIELLMELYGTEVLRWNYERPLTTAANQKKLHHKRVLADLQRKYDIWNPEELYDYWRNCTTAEERKAYSVTPYRADTIRNYAEEIINRRAEQQLTRCFTELSERDQRALAW